MRPEIGRRWGQGDVCDEGQEGKELLMPRKRRVNQPLGLGVGEGREQAGLWTVPK